MGQVFIGPQEVRAVAHLAGLPHLHPGYLLSEQVAGDLDVVAEDHRAVVAAHGVVRILGNLPQAGQTGPHLHQLHQGPAGQVQLGRVNVGQDLLSDVPGAGGDILGLMMIIKYSCILDKYAYHLNHMRDPVSITVGPVRLRRTEVSCDGVTCPEGISSCSLRTSVCSVLYKLSILIWTHSFPDHVPVIPCLLATFWSPSCRY